MDIQPPRPQAPLQPTGQTADTVPAEPLSPQTPVDTSSLGSEMHRPPDDDMSGQTLTELADAKPEDNESDKPKPPVHGSGKKAPKAVIAVAIVVAIGLIGLSIFAYMKTQDESPATGNTDTTTHEDGDNHAEPATANDVDAATKQVDAALEPVDETDFSESELTDQSLGL